jgi:cytochrome c oxidase cbb3-type subunit 3
MGLRPTNSQKPGHHGSRHGLDSTPSQPTNVYLSVRSQEVAYAPELRRWSAQGRRPAPTVLASVMAVIVFGLLALAATGCSSLPGRPGPGPEVIRPDQVLDFNTLYAQNCSACHGVEGKGGAALALADPVYLALVDDATLRKITTEGVPHTTMAGYARSAGGMLTDRQTDILVQGIRGWAKPEALQGATPPPYKVDTAGDAQRGAEVYATFCASCHGPAGKGGEKGSSIVDGSYLALVSDQYLRTIVICGRPELNAPDWQGNVQGRPMTAQEVSDVVAWLVAQRPQFPGQPYPGTTSAQSGGAQ